jgi:ribosomal-protein-alanine N-acetyltransferase
VIRWLRSVDDASAWAALDRLPELADLERWHAEPDVVPFSYLVVGRLVGYGELWEDREEGEAELARLVVAPDERGHGHGRGLARALAEEAHRRGFEAVWLRVVPDNAAARRAYDAAGFTRATPEQEAAFNTGQPRRYVWMRDAT